MLLTTDTRASFLPFSCDRQLFDLMGSCYGCGGIHIETRDYVSVTLRLVVRGAIRATCRHRRDALKNNELKS
jgi:hypothetical protein